MSIDEFTGSFARAQDSMSLCSSKKKAIKIAREYSGRIDLVKQVCAVIPRTKYLYMSGYTENAIVHRGVFEEGFHFLEKPFSIKDIAAKVREVLS